MSEFEYLAVFIAIVAGLSVAQTLSGLVRLVHSRRTMRIDTVHLLWTANLLVWLINWWWFSFSLVGLKQWTGGYLLYVLLYPTTIYFLLALLYPSDMPASFDAEVHLDSNRGWFFGGMLFLGVLEIVDALVKESAGLLRGGEFLFGPTTWYPAFMFAWLIASGVAVRSRHRLFNTAFAVLFLGVATWIMIWINQNLP